MNVSNLSAGKLVHYIDIALNPLIVCEFGLIGDSSDIDRALIFPGS